MDTAFYISTGRRFKSVNITHYVNRLLLVYKLCVLNT